MQQKSGTRDSKIKEDVCELGQPGLSLADSPSYEIQARWPSEKSDMAEAVGLGECV